MDRGLAPVKMDGEGEWRGGSELEREREIERGDRERRPHMHTLVTVPTASWSAAEIRLGGPVGCVPVQSDGLFGPEAWSDVRRVTRGGGPLSVGSSRPPFLGEWEGEQAGGRRGRRLARERPESAT